MVEQEKYILSKYVHVNVIDAGEITVYQRKLYLKYLMNDVEQQKKEHEKMSNSIKKR